MLVVEDDVGVQRSLVRLLKSQGYRVYRATRPSEVFTLLRSCPGLQLDMLITDVRLPEMNGREVADHVRALYPSLPVLFISGYTYETLAGEMALANSSYLQKPFLPQALTEMMEAMLVS